MKNHLGSKNLIPAFLLTACLLTNGLHAWTWTGQTGAVNDIALGDLVDDNVVQANEPTYINYSVDLAAQTYDIYIPFSYDGIQPFGLISFINSGNNGAPPDAYLAALEEKNIIWIGGNNIGNPIDIKTRSGVAIGAIYRAMELFNIDPARVYGCGNSGGGALRGQTSREANDT